MKQLDMDQLTHQVERHHLPQLIHRSYPKQPRHDPWIWLSLRIINHLLNDPL
jgi:hypothetical protein